MYLHTQIDGFSCSEGTTTHTGHHHVYTHTFTYMYIFITYTYSLLAVMSIPHAREGQVSFAKEPYKRDDILQKRPVI